MLFAVNYSEAAAALVRSGEMQVDRFKCPAWPDLIAEAKALRPVYVHCPLRVGRGDGNALNTETHQPADWAWFEAILEETDTPWVSLHLGAAAHEHPEIPVNGCSTWHVEQVTTFLLRDVEAAVRQLGPERVVVENLFGFGDRYLRPTYLPQVIRRVVEETGCGLLLDLSHARIAARKLGVDERDYLDALPVAHIREIHITGIQRLEGKWMRVARRMNVDDTTLQKIAGQWMDHLPLTETDWEAVTWAMAHIRRGAWAEPWIVALEYGGVGPFYREITEREILASQVPRLYAMVHTASPQRT